MVMLAIAISAVVAGGIWFQGFIAAVALITLVEFVMLVIKATDNVPYRIAAIIAGIVYIGLAAVLLAQMTPFLIVMTIGAVVAVDVGAYFAGRSIGGPKIAPSISPSKTWAGLFGGILGASLWLALQIVIAEPLTKLLGTATQQAQTYDSTMLAIEGTNLLAFILAGGAIIAVLAQSGDFLESWLKRKAGVKDSSRLIPGHGGFFDRIDGLIPVSILFGSVVAASL